MIISHYNKRAFLNLWSNVSREIESTCFYVVSVKGAGGEQIVGGDTSHPTSIPHVIIYSKKYTNNLSSVAAVQKPYHRAFVDSRDGKIKITAAGLTGDDAKYVGSNANMLIPSLDEAEWIAAGNAGLDKPATDLAANYASLSNAYKWSSSSDFNSNAVASAAPQSLGARLAGAARSVLEAVIPAKAKKKSPFEEAYLAALLKNKEYS
jgi:hypothetical protein